MGDIILGIFLILLTLGLYGIYRVLTRNAPETRSPKGFLSLIILVGGLIGMLTTDLNAASYSAVVGLSLLFFPLQTVASYLYIKNLKIGLPVLLFTFLLQVPIIHGNRIYYRSQTLLSLNLDNYPGKAFDIEPGSYIVLLPVNSEESSFGLNLIPIVVSIILLRGRKKSTKDRRSVGF